MSSLSNSGGGAAQEQTKKEIGSSLRALKTTLIFSASRLLLPLAYVVLNCFLTSDKINYVLPAVNLLLRSLVRNVGILAVCIANFETIRNVAVSQCETVASWFSRGNSSVHVIV